MMRRFLLVALAIACLLPAAAAQDSQAGCEETNPCIWLVDVDQDGFSNPSLTNFTQGDWFYLTICNSYDDMDHTVALEGHDLQLEVPAGECVDSEGFQFEVAGTFNLTDNPTGDQLPIRVIEGDVVEEEEDQNDPARETDEDPGKDDHGSPSPGMLALGLALLAATAFVARRQR